VALSQSKYIEKVSVRFNMKEENFIQVLKESGTRCQMKAIKVERWKRYRRMRHEVPSSKTELVRTGR